MSTETSQDGLDPTAVLLTAIRRGGGVATPVYLAAIVGYVTGFSEVMTILLVISAGVLTLTELVMNGWCKARDRPPSPSVARSRRKSHR